MVTKNQKKLIRSLNQKKNRKSNGLFVAEGIKVINEFLDASLHLKHLFILNGVEKLFPKVALPATETVTPNELQQLSFLKTAQKAVAVFEIPNSKSPNLNSGLQLVLDDVSDPGNLGTIIRLCDWFGISQLICSKNTVDCFNPKVVQATMGSLTRVNITYTDLKDYLNKSKLQILGTFMEGENIYKTPLPEEGIIVMGNEANGISPQIESLISKKISIPRFGQLQQTESLNVATATAILLSEFKRNS